MIPKLRPHRIAQRTDAELSAGILEFLHHLAFAEPAEVSAARFARARRIPSCEVLEACSLLELLLDLLRQIATGDENMTRFPFHDENSTGWIVGRQAYWVSG